MENAGTLRAPGWAHLASVLAAAALGAGALGAQTPSVVPSTLAPLVAAYGGLRPADLQEVARGEPAVVSTSAPDRDEVAMLGLIAVPAPRGFVAARLWTDFDAGMPGRVAGGEVRDPASPADFAALALAPSEADALKRCRPLHCSLKLPAATMAAFARSIDWSADPLPQGDSLFRRWLAERVNDYRARGDSALPLYDDTRPAERPADGFAGLLDESGALLRDAPSLVAYLRGAPTAGALGVQSAIYWADDHPEGSAPIVSVVQRATYTQPGDGAPSLVVGKQLYANHYFDARLDVAVLADGISGPDGAPGTYALVVRRVRFDRLASGGLFDLRGRVVRRLRAALRDELARTSQALARAYRAGAER